MAHHNLLKLLPWVDMFRQGQILQRRLLYKKNVTAVDSLEIISAWILVDILGKYTGERLEDHWSSGFPFVLKT